MRKEERLKENFGAAEITFTDKEFDEIEKELSNIVVYGNRTGYCKAEKNALIIMAFIVKSKAITAIRFAFYGGSYYGDFFLS